LLREPGYRFLPASAASSPNEPKGIAIDPTSVYWTDSGSGADGDLDGAVLKVALEGGAPVTIASGQALPVAIAVDATSVYWTTYGGMSGGIGSLMKAPLGGGAPRVLAKGLNMPKNIAVDAANVYWTDSGSAADSGTDGRVMKVGLDGGAGSRRTKRVGAKKELTERFLAARRDLDSKLTGTTDHFGSAVRSEFLERLCQAQVHRLSGTFGNTTRTRASPSADQQPALAHPSRAPADPSAPALSACTTEHRVLLAPAPSGSSTVGDAPGPARARSETSVVELGTPASQRSPRRPGARPLGGSLGDVRLGHATILLFAMTACSTPSGARGSDGGEMDAATDAAFAADGDGGEAGACMSAAGCGLDQICCALCGTRPDGTSDCTSPCVDTGLSTCKNGVGFGCLDRTMGCPTFSDYGGQSVQLCATTAECVAPGYFCGAGRLPILYCMPPTLGLASDDGATDASMADEAAVNTDGATDAASSPDVATDAPVE
jgi:hypothetical protein